MSLRTQPRHRRDDDTNGGVAGNERLTAMTGAVLLAGFAVEGVTILGLHAHGLLTAHIVIGFFLIGPVLLKIGSTLYRFFRYYTGAAPYVRKGPPAMLFRLLGPLVVATSLAVLGTGVMLAFVGPQAQGPWMFLHKASFVLWFCCMTVHVLAYAPKLPGLLTGNARIRSVTAGAGRRWLLLTAALGAGLLIAVLTAHTAGSWLHFMQAKPSFGASGR
jgi:hypothetical protein